MVTSAASEMIGYMLTISMEGTFSGLSRWRRSRDSVVRYMEMLSMVSSVAMKMASARKAVMSVEYENRVRISSRDLAAA